MNILSLATRGYLCDSDVGPPLVSTMSPDMEAKRLVPDITAENTLVPRTVGQVPPSNRPVIRPKKRRH